MAPLTLVGALWGCSESEASGALDAASDASTVTDLGPARMDVGNDGGGLVPDVASPDVGVQGDGAGLSADGPGPVDDMIAAADAAPLLDVAPLPDVPQNDRPFGSECGADTDCAVGFLCRSVGMVGEVCTKECQDDSMCPEGSMGQKCNGMGLCRP